MLSLSFQSEDFFLLFFVFFCLSIFLLSSPWLLFCWYPLQEQFCIVCWLKMNFVFDVFLWPQILGKGCHSCGVTKKKNNLLISSWVGAIFRIPEQIDCFVRIVFCFSGYVCRYAKLPSLSSGVWSITSGTRKSIFFLTSGPNGNIPLNKQKDEKETLTKTFIIY